MIWSERHYSFMRNIRKFIDHLIQCEAKKNSEGFYILHFDELEESDQGHLAMLFLERDDRDFFTCLEFQDYKQTAANIIRYLDSGNNETAIEMAESIRSNVIKYYSQQAQDLIDEHCLDLRKDELYEMGYRRRDSINGELMRC